ncbi:MAG: hypothetical protein HY716_10460 [Planctomycetes bacterium]|nr:hypothetical protein [Planctomycetota bacterium]
MNLLVYDHPPSVGRLLRSVLTGLRYRVSLSETPEDAIRKLDTGLFDALILGVDGAPTMLADHLESEWPTLPILLAGVAKPVPREDPIVAVLPRPLRITELYRSLRELERRSTAASGLNYDHPIDVVVGERRLACRILRRVHGSLLLEHAGAEALDEGVGCVTLQAATASTPAWLVFTEEARYLGVRVDDEARLAPLLKAGTSA